MLRMPGSDAPSALSVAPALPVTPALSPAAGALAGSLAGLLPPRPLRPARVRLFNVKYSPNLGDGLLAECLEQALVDCGTSADTWSVDLAGRTTYGTGTGTGSTGRMAGMRLLHALPPALRRLAVRVPLALQARRCWEPHYRAALASADCVVIGGGNLLTDLDLNFPTKLSLAVAAAAQARLPVFLYACGVSPRWSPRGRALLDGALASGAIRRVFVRDEMSRQAWNALAGSRWGLEAIPVRDPGLLAMRRYGLAIQPRSSAAPVIGLNLTSPLALQYHSPQAPGAGALEGWYLALAGALLSSGYRVTVFTNGSPEDRACLARLRPALEAVAPAPLLSFAQPSTPAQLACLVSGFSALAAFRMHAVIPAYACGVPFLALAWDPKLEAFVESVGLQDWLCHPASTHPEAAVERLQKAMRSGISATERERVVLQARRGVAMLHDAIGRALR